MATFNAGKTVAAAIDSVLAQQGVSVELLIADGLSKDDTVAVCRRYEPQLAVFLSERDKGVYDAWNKLIPKARGNWLCVLGADDEFASPYSLKELLDHAADGPPGCRVVYGRHELVDSKGLVMQEVGRPGPQCRDAMRWRMSIPHGGTLHARAVFDETGGFDPRFRIAGDYAMVRRENLRNGAHFVDRVVVRAGWGGLSTRSELEWAAHREVGQVLLEADGSRPLVWFVRALKIGIRMAIYRAAGSAGLSRYERLKSRLGLAVRNS